MSSKWVRGKEKDSSEDRALQLLSTLIPDYQYHKYSRGGGFIHCGYKYDYLIRKNDTIEVIDKDSLSAIGSLCILPVYPGPGKLPPTDVVIHQILWLKINENAVWEKGNFIPYS